MAIRSAQASVRIGLGTLVVARAPLFVHRTEPIAEHAALRRGRGRHGPPHPRGASSAAGGRRAAASGITVRRPWLAGLPCPGRTMWGHRMLAHQGRPGKVAGMGRDPSWEGGQTTTKARPTTALSGIVPSPGSAA